MNSKVIVLSSLQSSVNPSIPLQFNLLALQISIPTTKFSFSIIILSIEVILATIQKSLSWYVPDTEDFWSVKPRREQKKSQFCFSLFGQESSTSFKATPLFPLKLPEYPLPTTLSTQIPPFAFPLPSDSQANTIFFLFPCPQPNSNHVDV